MSFEIALFHIVMYFCFGVCGLGLFMMAVEAVIGIFFSDDEQQPLMSGSHRPPVVKNRQTIISDQQGVFSDSVMLTDADRKRYEKQIKVCPGQDVW